MQLTANQIGSSLKAGIEAGIEAGIGSGLAEALAGTIRLNNVLSSIHAYADMSPDMAMRRQVNSWMLRRDRQDLSCTQWCQLFGARQPHNPALTFIYESFGQYSGLHFGRVRPNDSLNSHLHFPLVCWFDWTITFCEEFFQSFGVDLSDRFDEADFDTIGELVDFLAEQINTAEFDS